MLQSGGMTLRKEYQVGLETLYRELYHEVASKDLAEKFSHEGFDGLSMYIDLANRLGMNEVSQSIQSKSSPEKVFHLLEQWSHQAGTTVGTLRTIFQQMRRDDAVSALDEHRLSQYPV